MEPVPPPLPDRDVLAPLRSPERRQRLGRRAALDQLRLVATPLLTKAADRAVEQDEEPGHHLVVAGRLGKLEQPLNERLVAKGVQGPIEVVEHQRPRRGPAIGEEAGANAPRASASAHFRSSSTKAGSPRSSSSSTRRGILPLDSPATALPPSRREGWGTTEAVRLGPDLRAVKPPIAFAVGDACRVEGVAPPRGFDYVGTATNLGLLGSETIPMPTRTLLCLIVLLGGSARTRAQSVLTSPKRDPKVEAILEEISAARIEASVRKLAGFGTRHTLSDPDDPDPRHRRRPDVDPGGAREGSARSRAAGWSSRRTRSSSRPPRGCRGRRRWSTSSRPCQATSATSQRPLAGRQRALRLDPPAALRRRGRRPGRQRRRLGHGGRRWSWPA